jgi:hypothetical protein
MDPAIKAILKKVGEYVALLTGVAVIGSLWINTEVERRMIELTQDPGVHPVIVELKAESANASKERERIEATQIRMEGKLDAFSSELITFLRKQAEQ